VRVETAVQRRLRFAESGKTYERVASFSTDPRVKGYCMFRLGRQYLLGRGVDISEVQRERICALTIFFSRSAVDGWCTLPTCKASSTSKRQCCGHAPKIESPGGRCLAPPSCSGRCFCKAAGLTTVRNSSDSKLLLRRWTDCDSQPS
jgi:hypothetical protein